MTDLDGDSPAAQPRRQPRPRRRRRSGFGTVEKLSSGRYRTCWREPNGLRVTGERTFLTITDARAFLATVETDLLRQTYRAPRRTTHTLGDYGARWVEVRSGLKDSTRHQYGIDFRRHVDPYLGRLTLDKIDWFTGAAARQACIEDGVPLDMGDNWCTGYYFRNVNPALRVVTVSSEAVVTTLDGNTPMSGDLTALADRITTPTGSSRPYRLVVTDGAITEVTEMYQP